MPPQVTTKRDDLQRRELEEISATCGLLVDHIEDVYATTPQQAAMFAESMIHDGAAVLQIVFEISPSLDLDRFCEAFQNASSYNATVRTRLASCSSGLVQVVTKHGHVTERPAGGLEEYIMELKRKPLTHGSQLFRSAIIDRYLVLTMHHAVIDHSCIGPLLQDTLLGYFGMAPAKRASFKEFSLHCSNMDQSMARDKWAARFSGAPAIFPKVEQSYIPLASYGTIRTNILKEARHAISSSHVTALIEAAWALTASAYTGSDSVAFGMVLSGRAMAAYPDAETTFGPTIVTVPVQVNLDRNMTIQDLLKAITSSRRSLQKCPALQYGLANIRTASEAADIATGFQAIVNIRAHWFDPSQESALSFVQTTHPHNATALCLSFDIKEDGLTMEMSSDPSVICQSQHERIANQFVHFLLALADFDRDTKLYLLPRLNSHDSSEIQAWNAEVSPIAVKKSLDSLVAAQVKDHPNALAIDAWDGCLTYSELAELSYRLALELRKQGVQKGVKVVLVFEKSKWAIVSQLAVLKAGGVLTPVSIFDPPARKAKLFSMIQPKLILTSPDQYKELPDLEQPVFVVDTLSITNLGSSTDGSLETTIPGELAYIIFTSGSSGVPKGVLLEHQSLATSLVPLGRELGWKPGTRWLQFASFTWDVSVADIMGMLISGGCICLPSENDRVSNLPGCMEAKQVNGAMLTPSVIRTLSPENVPSLQTLASTGEPVHPEAAKTWGDRLHFVNCGAPCEASIVAALTELNSESPYPLSIGRPVNCTMWIVNPRNVDELVPIGAVGEMLIEGLVVARGYLEDKRKTKSSFIEAPAWRSSFPSEPGRFYRAGDLAQYNPDGSIHLVGRQDTQVKIRGQRFELTEVETCLSACEEVREVFIATKIYQGRTELVVVLCLECSAFPRNVILKDIEETERKTAVHYLRTIKDFAISRLPSYMIPTVWLVVEAMPRTTSQKLDKVTVSQWLKTKDLATAMIPVEGSGANRILTAPSTPEQCLLQSLWHSVLGIPKDQIGQESSFVQLGGDSIQAMQIAAKCRHEGVVVAAASIMGRATLAEIASSSQKLDSVDSEGISHAQILPTHSSKETKLAEEILRSLEGRVLERAPFTQDLVLDNIEAVVPATDMQASVIAMGEMPDRGCYLDVTLSFPRKLDSCRLRHACELVIEKHAMLRTVLVRHGPTLYQLVLKNLSPNGVAEQGEKYARRISFQQGSPLAFFHLVSNSDKQCQRLCLETHHGIYDAISLGIILKDLNAAYTGNDLSEGPQFYTWASIVHSIDGSKARQYWAELLRGSSMPYLVPPAYIENQTLDKKKEIRVPLDTLKTVFGTPSSVVKSAWSLLLCHALELQDVVFGQVSANRNLPIPNVDMVKGPCMNIVPVRACLEPDMTLASLVAETQESSTAGVPHQHLGMGSLVKDLTTWPRHTRFSSMVVYQNHGAVDETIDFVGEKCQLSIDGSYGNATDIYVIAYPSSHEVRVEFWVCSKLFPDLQFDWIVKTFSEILELLPSSLESKVADVQVLLQNKTGTYQVPAEESISFDKAFNEEELPSPSPKALELVLNGWRETGLVATEGGEEYVDMWDAGSKVPPMLLLSDYYQGQGYNISSDDVARNPTQIMQGRLLQAKGLKGGN